MRGTIAAIGGLSLPVLIVLPIVAAVLGDAVDDSVGRYFGLRVWGWEQSRFFNRSAFDRTHAFHERHGAITIIVARFLLFVAGVAAMTYAKFALYDGVGAVRWICSPTILGDFVGNLPWVKTNCSLVALSLIIVPGLPALYELLRHTAFERRGSPV